MKNRPQVILLLFVLSSIALLSIYAVSISAPPGATETPPDQFVALASARYLWKDNELDNPSAHRDNVLLSAGDTVSPIGPYTRSLNGRTFLHMFVLDGAHRGEKGWIISNAAPSH
jgi:hypothetical protein